jgi:asparagine synthase (glutamine-hydrolysing)
MTSGGRPDPSLLRRMSDRLAHRGPDAYGSFVDDRIALGHRRLSIIDLASGDQPMGNEDGSVQVVFNGEIYNFRELRADLIRGGHRFRTESDTEVLVHLYEEFGSKMTERLNGMFAFALWDTRNNVLLLARDRLGKKPLYYSESVPGYRVVFASELKALLAIPGFSPRVDSESVADFLALSYVPDPHSIFRGVSKLEPAHWLRIEGGRSQKSRYWSPDYQTSKLKYADAVDHIRGLASDAVARRMISDVPLGAFLSGGLDSAAVTGLMSASSEQAVRTFSIGFSSPEFDETRWAELAATHNKTQHRSEIVQPDADGMLRSLADHFDEPFGDASAIPTLALCAMARRDVTVALSGDGADEIFGGYRRYRHAMIEEKIRGLMPRLVRRPLFSLAGRLYPKFDYLPQVFRAKTLLSNIASELGEAYFTSMSTFRDQGLGRVLSSEMRRSLGGYSPRDPFRQRFQRVRELSPLQQLQAVDLETYLSGDILVKVDRASMAHSLEVRSPWLDYRLVDFAFRIPQSWKIHAGVGKSIFRQAMSPYVPSPLLARRKMGFSVPLAAWLRTSLKGAFERQVLDGSLEEFVDGIEVRRLWAAHQSGTLDHSRKLWNLLVLANWKQRFLNSSQQTEFAADLIRR